MRPNDSSNWSNSSISKKGTTSMRQRLLRVMMPGLLVAAAVAKRVRQRQQFRQLDRCV